jgi:dihydroneopterin aldolase/2-amino-4-hydroxy-6-hydroxymethyldihydropteridine diphosphokinase/dihydropteroate synthase
MAAGLMPWQLWFDPGLGFAKHGKQSLQLIRHLPRVRRQLCLPVLRHAPMLLGPSRKVRAVVYRTLAVLPTRFRANVQE